MATEIRVDSGHLANLASQVLPASTALAHALAASRGSLTVSPAAFGNSVGGPAAHDAHAGVCESGAHALERMVEVIEGDVDRLYRVAFAYQRMDEDNAKRANGCLTGGPTPC